MQTVMLKEMLQDSPVIRSMSQFLEGELEEQKCKVHICGAILSLTTGAFTALVKNILEATLEEIPHD